MPLNVKTPTEIQNTPQTRVGFDAGVLFVPADSTPAVRSYKEAAGVADTQVGGSKILSEFFPLFLYNYGTQL